jgi:YD repeat-containing protein
MVLKKNPLLRFSILLLILIGLLAGLMSCRGEGEKGTPQIVATAQVQPTTPPAEKPLSVEYTYDDLGRLIRAEYSNGTVITYTYDAAGNLLKRTVTQEGP